MENNDRESLIKALDEAGLRQSALNLQNWDEIDSSAEQLVDDLEKAEDDATYAEELEKKYVGFSKLKGKLGAKGAYNPGALAAYIGRKKYGKKKFQGAAAKDKKMREMKPKQ